MQLELNTEKSRYMRVIDESVVMQEETSEVILPDSNPDIERVADTFVNVLLKSKEAEDGRAVIKGIVQAYVLYAAKDECLYSIEHTIPFTINVNRQGIVSDCAMTALVEAVTADAVTATSRKAVIRVNLRAMLTCFELTEYEICTGINDNSVYQKKINTEMSRMCEYTEKTFVVSDDIVIGEGREREYEILGCEHRFKDIGYSLSGNKVIIKGNIETALCIIAEDTAIPETIEHRTAFSQVLDTEVSESSEINGINLMMTGCYCDCNAVSQSSDSMTVSIEIHAVVQYELFEKYEIELLEDMYSSTGEIECQWEEISCITGISEHKQSVRVREVIADIEKLSQVIFWRISFGEIHRDKSGCNVNCYISAYGYNTNMELITVKKNIQVKCDIEYGFEFITANSTGERLELTNDEYILTCDVEFASKSRNFTVMRNVTDAEFYGDGKSESDYSVILYRPSEQDTLWDVCKRYRSSSETIMTVNGMESEALPIGKMLLIPKI